ncbi:FAD-dependent monooxygenase [Actinocorallia sp. API 0066]|uniref:FAD-dependent oxidoreductase n=1 Tax=Actinocorallia sp. API 0066 TaxID=2896846 RepID=UPI001E522472|nr:FAD-dependent monooxygenase [Actinocorallia sp. API 0066]MCD0451754.1 FAD-dependent monooxygenase [Actinocorallia sp. API 0066]
MPRNAVVVGAGFGGLVAARVLADHFSEVTILEQDTITEETGHRSGIPQARHPHALLSRGANILEGLFPGLRDELTAAGAPVFDGGESSRVAFPNGPGPRGTIGLQVQTVTRTTLERTLRRRVLGRPEITLRSGFRVEGLRWNDDRTRVLGVSGGPASGPPDTSEQVDADLVVFAAGRGSKLESWLTAAGYPVPEAQVIDGRLSYTTRVFRIPDDFDGDWKTAGEFTYAPHRKRGSAVVTVEDGRWLVSLFAAGGEKRPGDPDEFVDFARSLTNPLVAEAITAGEPDGPLYHAVKLQNRWIPYHTQARWPERFVVLGDAVCAFNPVYGQGMTVAAIEAEILQSLLVSASGDPAGLERKFQRRIAKALRLPWTMATSTDQGWSDQKPGLSQRIGRWYSDRLINLVPGDLDLYRRFFATSQMIASPATLLHPRVIAKVLTSSARSAPAPAQREAVSPDASISPDASR